MRTSILTLLLLLISQRAFAQTFTIDEKGIVQCSGAKPGDKATILGDVYEAADRSLLNRRSVEGADLTKVCTRLVTEMSALLSVTISTKSSFNQPIGNWDVNNVTTMRRMFWHGSLNKPIRNWDVSKVTNMEDMFTDTQINQPIGQWNVSNVTKAESHELSY